MPVSQLLLWYLGTHKGPEFKGSPEFLTPRKRLFLNKTNKTTTTKKDTGISKTSTTIKHRLKK